MPLIGQPVLQDFPPIPKINVISRAERIRVGEMNPSRILKFGALTLGLAVTLIAQSYRAKVSGAVTDQTGASVVGATVTLSNVNTGIKTVRTTNEAGSYLFDLVDPGTYTVTVELTGFSKFNQENVNVQTRGDVTVNATLKPGAVQESVTISDTPPAVEFNSSSRDLTIDSKLAQEMPRYDRNPFKLTLLAPSAVNTRGEMLPFHSWAANSVDLGGGTNLRNDLQVDGSPIGIGHKNSYPPNTDAVQEVVVSTNSVDAESGHSAGGLISITLKSGTNDWHGTTFYLGRYPWLNAVADRTRNTRITTRQHMMGGTLGNPIIKNKLFSFFSLEYWKVGNPQTYVRTVPTPLERQGDFSRSLNINSGLRTIYDPWSTTFNPATNTYNRTAFPGNVIPSNRIDPVSTSLLSSFWDPNGPGDNITGVNNFRVGFFQTYNYYNFSERVDYNINDNWRVYGRIGRYHTKDLQNDPTPNNSQLFVPTGTLREATQISGDAIWTVSPRTVVNVHGDWHKVVDAYVSESLPEGGWANIWPGNNWYESFQQASAGVPLYFPNLDIGGSAYGGGGFYWNQEPKGEAFNAKVSQQRGSHYLKAGLEYRRSYGLSFVSNTSRFNFPASLTADTPVNPNTLETGSGIASFLLGAMNPDATQMIGGPAPDPHNEYYGMFIQDDWKINRNITVNLGLRNDYETAYHDPQHFFARGVDLSAPIPEFAANPPQMPAQALALAGNNFYRWNGHYLWTDDNTPGMWDAPKFAWQPRAGVAIRISDKTALRVGYARYLTPTEMNIQAAPFSGFETVGFLSPPYFGVTGFQNPAPLLQGVPQARFADPFPANSNPLLPINGKAAGTNVGRGSVAGTFATDTGLFWYPRNFDKARNDRLNINFQRQLPGEIVASVTWFMNFGNQFYTKAYNNLDPRLREQQQNALNQPVDNPFYNYLTPQSLPGVLRNQRQVSLGSLLRPYPHYGGLYEIGVLGARERYQSLELRAQKMYSKGYNFLAAYVYIKEKMEINNFNDLDYFTNTFRWQDSDQPRHRLTAAGTWDLPVGKGRPFMGSAPRVVDYALGGWKLAGVWTYTSGSFIRFGNLIVNGSPCVDNPTPERWFNTSVFSRLPANTYVLRTNPLFYDCLTGPGFSKIDATLSKEFAVTERVRAEFKMAAYNAANSLNRGGPNTDINSSQFGQALFQGQPGGTFGPQGQELTGITGRQVEIGMKIIF
jgi:hypothetical protein